MASPKMTRHDMKQDDLVIALEKTKSYVDKNPMMVRNIAIGVAAVIILGRVAGIPENELASAAANGSHQAIVDAALKRLEAK